MILYRELSPDEIDIPLFSHFIRRQNVTKCRRKVDGQWMILDDPFVDDWTEEEYREGVLYLKSLLRRGGYVAGAFDEGRLKGFVSVEPEIFGTREKYLDLSNLHVSQDLRGNGIGKALFVMAKEWAGLHHAEKLYISAHSAVESQAFYQSMGCVEAEEYNIALAEKEPCDCQLECAL